MPKDFRVEEKAKKVHYPTDYNISYNLNTSANKTLEKATDFCYTIGLLFRVYEVVVIFIRPAIVCE